MIFTSTIPLSAHTAGTVVSSGEQVYWKNITHNLGRMATAAGIGDHLWEPDKIGIKRAGELIEPLETGIKDMEDNPERYKPFSASNGWGTYKQFIPWLKELLAACKEYPDAEISVSR